PARAPVARPPPPPARPGALSEEPAGPEEPARGERPGRPLELIAARMPPRRERDGRTLRAVVLGAALVEGGTWRERVVFREPLSDAGRMRLVLAQRLTLLPAPAEDLRLSVERFGPPPPAGAAPLPDPRVPRPPP